MYPSRVRTLIGACAVVALAACEHPIAVVTPHVEASELLVRDTTGQLLLQTVDNQRWSGGPLALSAGDSLPLVIRMVDFQGAEFGLESRGPEYSVRMDVEQASSAVWEPLRRWGWLRAFTPTATRIRFQIWHTDHADFVTPWLPLTVRAR
jgi:hypothetical protein